MTQPTVNESLKKKEYMETRLFNFDDLVRTYSQDPKMEEVFIKYKEKFNITKDTPIEEHPFYKKYLSKFNFDFEPVTSPIVDMSPEEWNFMARLIFGSCLSSYTLIADEGWKRNPVGKIRVYVKINVTHNGIGISTQLDDLFTSLAKQLFDIYVSEQIKHFTVWQDENQDYGWIENYHVLGMEAEGEDYDSWALKRQLKLRYKIFERQMESLKSEEEFYKKIKDAIIW